MPFHIQRFKNSLNAHQVGKSTQANLLQGCVDYDALTAPSQKAQWIGNLIIRLNEKVGEATARQVMQDCGRQCIGRSTLERARKLQRNSADVDDLLERLNQARVGGGKLRRKGDEIHASYERCYCGSVSKSRQPISITYCSCSCGWYQQLFETLLGKPVQVELIDSIAHGAAVCRFVIHI